MRQMAALEAFQNGLWSWKFLAPVAALVAVLILAVAFLALAASGRDCRPEPAQATGFGYREFDRADSLNPLKLAVIVDSEALQPD